MIWKFWIMLWCGSYHYYTTSFIKTWTQVLRRFKSCSLRVGDTCDDDPTTCVCVRRHKMPTSQHTSQFFVIEHACSIFADLSIVIGFPVSIQSIAVYLLNVYIAIPLSCGRFRAFYGANAPSPIWPDHHLADRCQKSIIWSI